MSDSVASDVRPSRMYDLSGRIALVTGGGSGIGLMIAKGLAGAGARVYIAGRRPEKLEEVSRAYSDWAVGNEGVGALLPLDLDVSDKDSIASAQASLQKVEGRLHILVNNAGQVGPVSRFFNDMSAPEHKDAGTLGRALFDNESVEQWASHYTVNTFSLFFMTTCFLGLLDKGSKDIEGYTSCVINLTSISGIVKIAQNHFAYNSAKAAASHLTKMLATELALKKIPVRVNAIAPGVYASEMTYETIDTPELVAKVSQAIVPVPISRGGSAQEMAGTAVYLASRAGCFTNGQELVVDGGYIATNPSTL